MSKRYDVAILGGGVVGHTLALLLARDRLRVALVGREPACGTGPDVRAYALNTASRQLLESVRAWPQATTTSPAAVTPVTRMWVSDATATHGAAVTFDAADAGVEALSWIVDVPALEQCLAQAVGFQAGIDRLTEPPTQAALTVVCEGRRSATRDALGIEYDRRTYPHTALAARFNCARPHGGVARQWFHGPDILALLPLDGEQGHSVAMVWSLPHERAAACLALAPEALAQQVEQACDLALGPMALQGPAAGWPLELSRAERWVQPGVALAGDAAHAMHPLAGQGLNVGLGDAAELARVLHEREFWRELGDLKLLRRYERARQAAFSAMAWTTDGLFGLFGHGDSRLQWLRHWGLRAFNRSGPLKRWTTHRAMGHVRP
jgi:2-polyprenyl-6-methoxyphenol hydroxylase-like FAD-dependent oxidoreductase